MLPRVAALVAVAWFSLVGREVYQIFLFSTAIGDFRSFATSSMSFVIRETWNGLGQTGPLEMSGPTSLLWAGTDLFKCCCRGNKTCDLITKLCRIFTYKTFNDNSSVVSN